MIFHSDEEDSFDNGPRKLLQKCLSQFHPEIKGEKLLLSQKSKFKIALDHLQEDYKPSEEVSCRDEEKKKIYEYLKESLDSQGCSESLYISGVPGIGKTLCVNEVLEKIKKQYSADTLKVTYTNALSMKTPIEIFRSIYFHFTGIVCEAKSAMYKLNQLLQKGIDVQPPPMNNYQKQFRYRQAESLSQRKKLLKMKKILVIDEVDYLVNRTEDVLYNIFQWTQKKKSHLIIISICNTMDFPQKLSPKVNSRMGNLRLVFKPYGSTQIESILNQRIKKLDVFDENAITYTCKKLAVCSSDIRKCLNVLREAIFQFIHRQKTSKKILKDQDLKNKKITAEILSKVQDKIYRDLFVNIFPDFPNSYKIVLYFLARHFRAENTNCTLRKLQQLASGYAKDYNQLLPTLNDLKQFGIVKITYTHISRTQNSGNQLVDMKQLRYEHIQLLVPSQKIIYALQKEDLSDLSKGNFRMDLNF